MQDSNPQPWGALDRFQAHFIVRKNTDAYDPGTFVAKTKFTTKGHFASKSIQEVSWDGPGTLAAKLNEDTELNQMIAKESIKNATIYIEPTQDAVRIRGKWDNHLEFGISKELYAIYDSIAAHIGSLN